MNGEPLTDEVRAYERAMRPLSDWKFYLDFPQRILNNLGNRLTTSGATDDLAMQAQLYWVVTRLLDEVEGLRESVDGYANDISELEEQLADCQAEE